MASFRISKHTKANLLLLLLALFLSSYQLSRLAAADRGLIQIVCHESDAPEVCVQCLNSDPGAESADKVGLTTIVVNCLNNHADSLEDKLSNMSSVSKDQSSKDVLMECSKGYLDSKKDLLSAIVSLKSDDYDNAEKFVTATLYRHFSCLWSIKKNKVVKISSKVACEMRIYEDLCQIADRMIERL
ncbi:Putative invertase inhibitor [Morus notabilis]|uniref:Putative invertase inhibitor n=1 Tax=Morus notabilis TaxID=981085 RepID=W9QSH5_9ROSA|nr:uncharacterized protein LOC21399310 [Morus notabilis]EXB53373.1 Putative invertase inhibitor [Morus notabilis]